MGVGNQPSHPSRPTSTSNHFTALPPRLLGKVSAAQEVGLPTWLQRAVRNCKTVFSWTAHDRPLGGGSSYRLLQGFCHGRRYQHSQDPSKSKTNVRMRHLQRAPECFSGFSCWSSEERGHLHPLLMCKPFNSFLTAHRCATLAVPCGISSPCSQIWRLRSITTSISNVSFSDPIWGANTASANMLTLGLWISICTYRA